MESFHRWLQTGHTAATLKEIPAMLCDGLDASKITGK